MDPRIELNADGFPRDAWSLLKAQLKPERVKRMEEVAGKRLSHLRLVLQDLFDLHNIAACLRSAEAFGVLDVDVVDRKSRFHKSNAGRGSQRWLRLSRYDAEEHCARELKSMGYRICGAFPSAEPCSLDELPLDQPLAVVFGNEHEGLGGGWEPYLDQRFNIPMHGMVESLNISVAAAVTLYQLTQRIRKELPPEVFGLDARRREDLLCTWICQQVPTHQLQLERLRSDSTL